MRNDDERERRALDLARAEEERLGPASEPWVQVAVLNQWNGGPAAALGDVAVLRRRAEATAGPIWPLKASVGEAIYFATLIRGAAPAPDEVAGYIVRIREIVEQAETYGQPSSIADARASLGIALRSSEPAAALALLEDALDLCAPLGVEESSSTARCELASHYTQLGRPRERVGPHADGDPGPRPRRRMARGVLSPGSTAQAFADVGRPRVAATILGQLGAGPSEFNQSYYGFPALHDQLVAEVGAAELAALVDQRRSRTLADVADLAIDTINEIVEDPGPEV